MHATKTVVQSGMHKANLIGVGSPRALLGSLCPKGTRRYPVAIAFNASGEGRIWRQLPP